MTTDVRTSPALDPEERADRLLADLGTTAGGLGAREADRRLAQHGPNEIRRVEGEPLWRRIVRQLVDPLALLLWAASAFAVVEGSHAVAIVIVAVIVLNAVFALAQERQAERATEVLREYISARVRMRRDGRASEIEAGALVPGDIVLVGEGERLAADVRILDRAVEVDMSPLTGESQPVLRTAARSHPAATRIEAEDLLFTGTLCTGGEAVGVVYAKGMATQLGRIAALSQRVETELTPLQRQVNHAAKLIAVFGVISGVVLFAVGTLVAGLSLGDSLNFAIGLLVANVPEGLLPTITLALAVGARRMARRRALIRRLPAVETLGSTDVICTDKTGTLTEGRMAVKLGGRTRASACPGATASTESRGRACFRPPCAATTRRRARSRAAGSGPAIPRSRPCWSARPGPAPTSPRYRTSATGPACGCCTSTRDASA